MALCVHPDFTYVRARDPASGRVYIVAESRLKDIPGAVPKPKKGKKGADAGPPEGGWQVSHLLHLMQLHKFQRAPQIKGENAELFTYTSCYAKDLLICDDAIEHDTICPALGLVANLQQALRHKIWRTESKDLSS